ncbi:5-oxoprolinase subunit PxpB [Niallia circulans]|uniref:5-oxoprolinase subunit PxpB n=1 Tax=Niallia circulans TaxID=1397 RepID=UPI001F2DC201|nr:5-oxoprolinase subunit PxpB [Niallia circulans]
MKLIPPKTKRKIEFLPMGEQILIVQFEGILSIENNQMVQHVAEVIKSLNIRGVKDIVKGMCNFSILYDPLLINFEQLKDKLSDIDFTEVSGREQESRTVHIPVVFDEQYGLDLPELAKKLALSEEEIVEIITSNAYYVYMIGFIAGLPYMGNLDKRMAVPRKSNPRVKVPKGAVAIADKMTSIYTVESPGGWHIVGWTPMDVFDGTKNPPNLIKAGDYVKYEPISAEVAQNWNSQVQKEWNQLWNI